MIITCAVQRWFILYSMLTIMFVMKAVYASLRCFFKFRQWQLEKWYTDICKTLECFIEIC